MKLEGDKHFACRIVDSHVVSSFSWLVLWTAARSQVFNTAGCAFLASSLLNEVKLCKDFIE